MMLRKNNVTMKRAEVNEGNGVSLLRLDGSMILGDHIKLEMGFGDLKLMSISRSFCSHMLDDRISNDRKCELTFESLTKRR